MPDDRWHRIESLFQTLLDAPDDQRQTVLSSLSDPGISEEVERLLKAHDELSSGGSDFLARLDPDRTHALVEAAGGTAPGMRLGRYLVDRALGRGGMGVVYLAHDPRLDRPVAIKVLPQYLSGDADAVRRLAAEARAASALDHPNIATVYEIAETDDAQTFIVMAYYDGETLRERLTRERLGVEEALDIGIQLAEGLSAAHRAGVIHRDVKPENLILARDGILKIVDFGIAKAATADLVTGATMRGTAAYMSPEQSRGDPVDAHTDVWSAGVVLYEALAGHRPFRGDGEALLHAIRHDSPPPLARVRPDVPRALITEVNRCLDKAPERRHASASALGTALRSISLTRLEGRLSGGSRAVAIGAAAGAALLAGLLFLNRDAKGPDLRPAGVAAAPAIAVLPFEVRGTNLAIWREGMVDLLSANLDNAAGMRAIDSRTVLARWTRRVTNDESPDLGQALAVARETGARYAVLGTIIGSGSGIRITGRLHTLDGDSLLAAPQVEGSADSVFALVDQLSIALLAASWEGRERPTVQTDVARITTRSLPALKSYLDGERFFRSSHLSAAIKAYEDAIAADSTFALAYYHLGVALGWLGNQAADHASRASAAFRSALRHSGRLPTRDRLLLDAALAFYLGQASNLGKSRERLLLVTKLYPDDPEGWYNLGEVSFHAGEQLLTPREEALSAFRTAVQLDPGFALAYEHLIHYAIAEGRDSAHAANLMRQYQALAPHSDFSEEHRLNLALTFGDWNTRQRALADVPRTPWPTLSGVQLASRDHPEIWPGIRAAIAAKPRSSDPTARYVISRLCLYNFAEGRVVATMRCLTDSLLFEGYAQSSWYTMHLAGVRLPARTLDSLLTLPPHDTSYAGAWVLRTFIAGAYAADRRRWPEHASAVRSLGNAAQRLLSRGDSAGARFTSATRLALEGHGLTQRGNTDRGIRQMARGQRESTWLGSRNRLAINEITRWLIAQALLDEGRLREASAYFESLRPDPWAARLLAQTYERLGDYSKARSAYEFVAQAWSEADPEIRPLAEEAAAGAARVARRS